MTLEDIIQNSAESELLSVEIVVKQIVFKIYHDGMDRMLSLKLPYISFYSTFSNQAPEVCFMNIEKIASKLTVKNGVYVAAEDFPTFMSEVRQGLHLAYGLRVSQYAYIFQLIGSVRVVVPLKSLDNVEYAWT